MPVSKSAEKELRVADRRHERNKSARTEVKSNVSKAEKAIQTGKSEAAVTAVTAAASSLDKAAVKGVIHPNKAARSKSRLMKKLNKAATVSAETKPAEKK